MQVDGLVKHSWVIAVAALIGCIDEARPLAEVTDTSDTGETTLEVEVEVEPDTEPNTEVDSNVVEVDSADGSADADEDVFVPQCTVDEDCQVAITGPCTRWFCNNQRCKSEPAIGDACDDGDQCTGEGTCAENECVKGEAIDCTAFHPQCWTSFGDLCDPELGCPGIAAVADEACDDGNGREPYTCVDGWNVPPDGCDGAGQCVDRDGDIPVGIHPLAGDWFAVLQSTPAPGDGDDAVVRFSMELRQDGGVYPSAISSSDGDWKAALEGRSSPYCADADGRASLTIGNDTLAATIDASRSLMLLRSDARRAIGLAIRPSGTPSAVHGRYRLVTTSQQSVQFRSFTSRTGFVDFSNGCLSGTGIIQSAGDGLSIQVVATEESCLDAVGDNVHTSVGLRVGGITVTQTWYGAIGLGGDVLVLVAGDDARTYFGLVILVRDRGDAPLPALPGDWSFGMHRDGYDGQDTPTSVTFAHGSLVLGSDFTSIGGTVFGDDGGLVLGGWWFTNSDGRYAQRATLGEAVVHLAGVVARGDNLIIGWVADPPVDTGTPQTLGVAPREGSLFIGVKNAPLY